MTLVVKGYLEQPYLGAPYLASTAEEAMSSQVTRVISNQAAVSQQVKRQSSNANGQHSQAFRIITLSASLSTQVSRTVAAAKVVSAQVSRVVSSLRSLMSQVKRFTSGKSCQHEQMRMSPILHATGPEYLSKPYLATPYLANDILGHMRSQVNMAPSRGTHLGAQVNRVIPKARFGNIQIIRRIDSSTARHSQVIRINARTLSSQVTAVLYNKTNLRILSNFPSRGLTGSNWSASSTEFGDFNPNNLNNDIVEFYWRSASTVTALVSLTCDTQISQGVFVDTIAILNHNLSRSASVLLQASNDSTFSVVGEEITLNVTQQNMYYIAPTLPNKGYRYYRFLLQDPANTDGYLRIGTIIFGAATIFVGDDITDSIIFGQRHFKDTIVTEGFTSVSNDRALKNYVRLNFQDMDYNRGNYRALASLFQTARTSQKVLWIPDPLNPTRFAVFGKLVQIPETTTNYKGPDMDYVSLQAEVDESL